MAFRWKNVKHHNDHWANKIKPQHSPVTSAAAGISDSGTRGPLSSETDGTRLWNVLTYSSNSRNIFEPSSDCKFCQRCNNTGLVNNYQFTGSRHSGHAPFGNFVRGHVRTVAGNMHIKSEVQKFRGVTWPWPCPRRKIFMVSCPDNLWEHASQIWSL